MSEITIKDIRSHKTSIGRWSAIGPYYAMFPLEFAFDVIKKYSKEGDYVFDPFAGRGTTLFLGGVLGRKCDGIEINPLGWLYSYVKLNPVKQKGRIINRLHDVYKRKNKYREKAYQMPIFYKYCFCFNVLTFLLSARENLNWKNSKVDATLMAIIVYYLHNRVYEGLSNQMQLTKSMGMQYAIDWWKKNDYETPPKIDPLDFLISRIDWRYHYGVFDIKDCSVINGDSTDKLNIIERKVKENKNNKYSLLLTSPPYYGVTDYYADQWLRLWMLGSDAIPQINQHKHKGRFKSKEEYSQLLQDVFQKSSKIMKNNSVVYVRTDAREFTLNTTVEILKMNFPDHNIRKVKRPLNKESQTHLYNRQVNDQKPGEVDIILTSKFI